MKLDPRTIMQFSAIAEEASFTKAAARLGVAQPWLSARVRKLEERLGFLLFVRDTRNVTLTERGAEFLGAAQSVTAAIEAAEALASQLQRREERRLRIGVIPHSEEIPARRELLDRYMTQHRDVVVELEVGWTPSLLPRVRSGDLDAAFVAGHFKDEFDALPVCHINVELLMAKDNPLARHNMVALPQLAGRQIANLSRAVDPDLVDKLCMPLIQVGVRILQFPELSEILLERLRGPEQLIALWPHLDNMPMPNGEFIWRPLDTSPKFEMLLIRRRGGTTPIGQAFWEAAS